MPPVRSTRANVNYSDDTRRRPNVDYRMQYANGPRRNRNPNRRNRIERENEEFISQERRIFGENLNRTNNKEPPTLSQPLEPFYGNHYGQRLEKAVLQMGIIVVSTYGHNYFGPFMQRRVDVDFLRTTACILRHHGTGGNFRTREWLNHWDRSSQIDFENLPRLLVPLSAENEPRLENSVPFVTGRNPDISNFIYQSQMAYIAENMKAQPKKLMDYFEILLLDPEEDSYDIRKLEIIHGDVESKNKKFLTLAMEKVGKMLLDQWQCWSCGISIRSEDRAVRHVLSKHRPGFGDNDEPIERQNSVIRSLKDEIAEKKEQLRLKDAIIFEKNQEIGAKDEIISQKDDIIAELQRQLAERNNEN